MWSCLLLADAGSESIEPGLRRAWPALAAGTRQRHPGRKAPVSEDASAGAGILGRMENLYEAVGGRPGLLRLAEAWHARVMADEVVSHAFSHGVRPDHSERLAAYWGEALGGPTAYTDTYGDESSVVRMHSGHGPHEDMDRRAIACFDQALDDVGLPLEGRAGQALHAYFSWATTTTMAGYPESEDAVPARLDLPHWSWDGVTG